MNRTLKLRMTSIALALLALTALTPWPMAQAHSTFGCPKGLFLDVATGDESDGVPDLHDVTYLTLSPLPEGLSSFSLTAWHARGNVRAEALEVRTWHDWDGSTGLGASMHIYVEAGAAFVRIQIDDCMMHDGHGGEVPAMCDQFECWAV